jgi:hypothetical protein
VVQVTGPTITVGNSEWAVAYVKSGLLVKLAFYVETAGGNYGVDKYV